MVHLLSIRQLNGVSDFAYNLGTVGTAAVGVTIAEAVFEFVSGVFADIF